MAATTSIPPPPKAGSGGLIAASAVMVVLMGGLLYWRLSAPAPPPPEAPKPVVAAAPTPELEEPLPPPPKIEQPAEAGEKPAEPRVGRSGVGGGCAGECQGNAPAALRSALGAKANQARGCYDRALRQNSMLQGRLVLSVRVGPQGQVCRASVAENGLGDPGLASCVVQMFRSATFPPAEGGCVDTAVPMNFVPKT